MPTVPAGDLTLLRADGHKSDVYTSFLPNIILWEARINDVSIVQGETSIDFDAGTGSFFSLIEALQEVWVGSSAEDNDVGRLRIKSISSGDGGVTGTVTVAGHSFPLQDDDYLTFHHNYPLKPRYSWVDPATEIWYMDDDVVYSDQHEEPPPIVIAGEHRGGFLIAGSFFINVNSSSSYAVASGASISSYALTVASTAGSPTVNFSSVTGLGDITFTAPGYYWAKYTVTDSNGKSQVSYRCYFVCEKDRSSAFHPFVDTESIVLTGDWETGGWIAGIEAKDGYSLDEIPFHTLCVIWRESWYGSTKKAITFLPDSSTTIFAGYVRGEVEEQDFDKGLGHVDLVLSTVEGRLRRMYSFSASIVAQQTTVDHWSHGPTWMTVGIIAAYLIRWRSTLFEVADVFGLKDNTWLEAGFEPDDNNLYDMVNNYTLDEGIRAKLVCDMGGRMHLSYDNQLLIDAERSALLTTFDIKKDPTAADYGGSLIVARAPEPEAPFVSSNGIYWDGTTWDEDNRPEATGDWCVIAPGGKPLHEGPNPMDFPAQIIPSLDYLKQLAGRYLAKSNNEIEEVRIAFSGDYLGVLDPAYDNAAYTISLQASDMPRGVAWNAKPLYLRNVTARYSWPNGLFNVDVNASFEPESAGITGVETECPSFPLLGGEIVPIPIPEAAPGALLTGSSVHQKLATENAWTELHTEDVDDLIVDPFWKLKTGSVSPSDAIVMRSGLGYIERSIDGGVTFSDVTPTTNPPNDAGDAPAPLVGNVRFNMLEGSFVNQDEFVSMVTWQNASSEWRTWLYYSDDNFATDGDWEFISDAPANNLSSFNTPSTTIQDGTSNISRAMLYGGCGGNGRAYSGHLAKMSDTKFVVVYEEHVQSPFVDWVGYAQVIDVNADGSISVGLRAQWSYENGGDSNVVGFSRVYAWDSIYFIIVSFESDFEHWQDDTECGPASGNSLMIRAGSVAGNSVSFFGNTNYPLMQLDEFEAPCTLPEISNISFTRIPNSHYGIVNAVMCRHTVRGNDTGYSWVVWRPDSGYTITFGDPHIFENASDEGGVGVDSVEYAALPEGTLITDLERGAIFFNDVDTLYVRHVTLDLTYKSMSFGSRQTLNDGQDVDKMDIAVLTPTRIVVVFASHRLQTYPLKTMLVERTGTSYAVIDTEGLYTDDEYAWWLQIRAINQDKWIVAWAWDDIPDENWLKAKIGYMAGGAIMQYGSTISFSERSELDAGVWKGMYTPSLHLTPKHAVFSFYDSSGGIGNSKGGVYAITADLPTDPEARGLGISMTKGTGTKVWLTLWANSNGLQLVGASLPSLALTNRRFLGAATLAEVNNRARYALPYADFSGEDSVSVGGNMDNPYSMGDPIHILYSSSAGATASLVEDGWGVDFCGSIIVIVSGKIVAIRNRFNQSKLYMDNVDFDMLLKVTLPFAARVAPHGMYVNQFSGDIYVASWEADPVMVAVVSSPYATPRDLTYDHDNSEGVQSIVEL